VIRDPDVVESFVARDALQDEILYGVLVELNAEDPVNPKDDVWIVLINDNMWKMLRYEFEPVR
jgi:hypothetical protein